MIKLAHLSDVHITAPRLGWRWHDWLTKRLPGWVNFRWMGRRFRFRQASEVLTLLVRELKGRSLDCLIFSGDATALGFETEFRKAAELFGIHDAARPAGFAVPGNHDYYTRGVAASGLFERYFAPWQQGLRVDDAKYPFARRVGHIWLVAVNSCTGNRWMWDASGRAGAEQLDRLRRLLAQLESGPRVLVTHYPVCLSSGKREKPWHGLRDLDELLHVAKEGGVGLWLHGHRHEGYHFADAQAAPFPVICAGSATQNGLWSYNEYHLEERHCRVTRRTFAPATGRFSDGATFALSLPR